LIMSIRSAMCFSPLYGMGYFVITGLTYWGFYLDPGKKTSDFLRHTAV
jgi:hypothetical protein